MPARSTLFSLVSRLVASALALCLPSCSEKEEEADEDRFFKEPAKRVEQAHRNRLDEEATAFLRSRADDPLPWQPWNAELFAHAKAEQKQVFALMVSGNHPLTLEALEKLRTEEPAIREELQANYLCSLIDLQAHPEMALLAYNLCMELRRPVSIPFMIWFSHEGDPVAWLPLARREIATLAEVFDSANAMVKRLWSDDPRYVVSNSRRDNEARVGRLEDALLQPGEPVTRKDLREPMLKSARQLGSLYDPTSGMVDGAGGLVPFFLLQWAAKVAAQPDAPPNLPPRMGELVTGSTETILRSAIADPLDGGIFYARRSRGWDLPVFVKDAATQLEGITSLARTAALTGKPRYLDAARRTLAFANERLRQSDGTIGLFEIPATPERAAEGYLWSEEEIRELLQPEEAKVALATYGVTALGNIPFESDPQRNFFRMNSLALRESNADVAATLGMPEAVVGNLLEAGRQRLLVKRRELLDDGSAPVEPTAATSINARYASALATLSRVSGDEQPLADARTVLKSLRNRHYSAENGLMRIAAEEGRRGIPARGIDYATLLLALFDTYRLDLDPAHLSWAEALAREALDKLLDEAGLLREVPRDDRIHPLPLHSTSMVFGLSTWGALYGPLERLSLLTGDEIFAKAADAIRCRLAPRLEESAVIHTDFCEGTLVSIRACVVHLTGKPDDPAFDGLHRLLLAPEWSGVTVLHQADGIPSSMKVPSPGEGPGAVVIIGGEAVGEAANAAELEPLLRQSAVR